MDKQTRSEMIKAIRSAWLDRYGEKITASEASAALRGECSTEQYRFVFNIAREYGF